MDKKIYKILLFFLAFTFLFCFKTNAESVLKITSVEENFFTGRGITVKGTSPAENLIQAGIRDSGGNLIYSLRANSDSLGNWSVIFNQPIARGTYYIEAESVGADGAWSQPVRSEFIDVAGPFTLIIYIFSVLVIILLAVFLAGWYLSKRSEIRRYRRILISERDIESLYKLMKNDVDLVLKKIKDKGFDDAFSSEIKFLLSRVGNNLENMQKYVSRGISVLRKYDIITKIDKIKEKK